jgi:hypothetical protein
LTFTFWGLLFILGIVFPAVNQTKIGIPVFIGCLIFIGLIPSFMLSKLTFGEWYNEIAMCGVRKLGYSMTMLGRSTEGVKEWYEPLFVFYWGFCVKYLIPTTLWFILVGKFKADFETPYGGYSTKWQVFGLLVPLVGFVAFLLSMCLNVYEEPFDKEQFEDMDRAVEASNAINKVSDEGSVEMKAKVELKEEKDEDKASAVEAE